MKSAELLLVAFVATTLCVSIQPVIARKTSILVLLCDDLGYGDVQYSRTNVSDWNAALTPNLNAMSKSANALRFDNFHSASSVCSPTRASMLSGRHPDRDCVSGANAKFDLPGQPYKDTFPFRKGMPSVARTAKTVGYKTAFFGKWHLGPMENRGPDSMGFDTWLAAPGNIPTYDPACLDTQAMCQGACNMRPRARTPANCTRIKSKVCTGSDTSTNCYIGHFSSPLTFCPDWSTMFYTRDAQTSKIVSVDVPRFKMSSEYLVDKFAQFLPSVPNNQAFFAYLWFNEPHMPFYASPALAESCMKGDSCIHPMSTFNRSTDYYAVVVALDNAIGRVRNLLKANQRASDTLLIFTSDNGPEDASRGGSGSPAPYRAYKGTVFEGSHRLPGLIEWPARVSSNAIVNGLASALDLRKTFIDLFAQEGATKEQLAEGNQDVPLDGVSLLPVFASPKSWKRPVPFGICQPVQAPRPFCHTFAYSDGRWKIVGKRQVSIARFQKAQLALYDVDNDPQERNDVSKIYQDIYAVLRPQAIDWVMNVTRDFQSNCKALARTLPKQK